MPTHMIQFSYSMDAARALVAKPHNRRDAAAKVIAASGGTLVDIHFCFGEFDGVAMCDFPSNVEAAAAALTISSSGSFSRVHTTPLISMEEGVKAMETAGQLSSSYTPPTG